MTSTRVVCWSFPDRTPTWTRVCALLHKTDLKIKNPVLGPVVMDTDHAPHHVTSWYCVVQISVVTIDPATVEAVVQTHSWFFTTVETEASVLCSVVMVTTDAIHNATIRALESDWLVKIIRVLWPETAFRAFSVLSALEVELAILCPVVMVTYHPVDWLMWGTRECERFVIVIDPGLHPKEQG